jgi:small nuclear ribonucleoprotein (snRNP)-like protein
MNQDRHRPRSYPGPYPDHVEAQGPPPGPDLAAEARAKRDADESWAVNANRAIKAQQAVNGLGAGPKPNNRGPAYGSPIINKLINKIITIQFKSGRKRVGKLLTVDHQGWARLDTSWAADGIQDAVETGTDPIIVINIRQAEVIA